MIHWGTGNLFRSTSCIVRTDFNSYAQVYKQKNKKKMQNTAQLFAGMTWNYAGWCIAVLGVFFDLQRGDVYVKRYSVAVLLSGLGDNMHLTDNMHLSDNMRRTSIFTRRKSLVLFVLLLLLFLTLFVDLW